MDEFTDFDVHCAAWTLEQAALVAELDTLSDEEVEAYFADLDEAAYQAARDEVSGDDCLEGGF